MSVIFYYPVQNVSIVYVLPDLPDNARDVAYTRVRTWKVKSGLITKHDCSPVSLDVVLCPLTAIPAVTLRQYDSTLRSPAENPTLPQSIANSVSAHSPSTITDDNRRRQLWRCKAVTQVTLTDKKRLAVQTSHVALQSEVYLISSQWYLHVELVSQ